MLNQIFATKYRPKNFSELKGQDVLVKILSNAISKSKIANAYIVTGIRGVGKTTTARIIAKTINCENKILEGNIPVPCEKCNNCLSTNNFNHPDVMEIDAASKTGVNDIREIIENSKYKASLGQYKIYIVDEVHMLSNSAFNALLKTLEEPPDNILFIFATTEIQKVPATIISRCQRFDLLRISSQKLSDHLEKISTTEGIKFKKTGLDLIAKFSEGSARDALSLLETVNIYKDENQDLDESMVNEVLGVPKLQSIYELLSNIIDGKADLAIKSFHSLNRNGSSVSLILEELLQLCNKVSKSIVIEKFIEDSALFDHEKPLLQGLREKADITSVANIWKLLLNGLTELKSSNHPLYVFEMILIRVCHLSNIPKLSEVIKSIPHKKDTPYPAPTDQSAKKLQTFKEAVDLFYINKELILYKYLSDSIAITEYSHGIIKASTNTKLPSDFTQQILALLNKWTNEKWVFELSSNTATENKTLKDQELDKIKDNDIVKAINSSFPGAVIKSISKTKN
jgi:DNA polymerase III subunit gamma/tau